MKIKKVSALPITKSVILDNNLSHRLRCGIFIRFFDGFDWAGLSRRTANAELEKL